MQEETTLFLLACMAQNGASPTMNQWHNPCPPMPLEREKIERDAAERIRRAHKLGDQSRNEQQKALLLAEVASLRCAQASTLLEELHVQSRKSSETAAAADKPQESE